MAEGAFRPVDTDDKASFRRGCTEDRARTVAKPEFVAGLTSRWERPLTSLQSSRRRQRDPYGVMVFLLRPDRI